MKRLLCIAALSAILAAAAAAEETRPFVSVAIMKFDTASDAGETFLGDSFANSLATKLAGVSRIKLYERTQFAKLAGELGLSQTDLVDRSTVQAVGKIVALDYMIVGSVTSVKNALRVNMRVTEVKSSRSVLAEEIGGTTDDFFDIQDTFAARVIDALSLVLTERERETVFRAPTKSPGAYALYNSSLAARDAEERIRSLQKALEKDPTFLQALHLLADTYTEIGMPEESRAVYDRILRNDPDDFKALYNSALLSFDAGENAQATERLLACAVLKPSDPDVWYHLGLVHEFNAAGERQGAGADLAASHRYYREAVNADPDHLEATFALGLLEIRFAQESDDPAAQKDHLEAAVRSFERYLAAHPDALNAAEVSENLALLKEALRQIAESLEKK